MEVVAAIGAAITTVLVWGKATLILLLEILEIAAAGFLLIRLIVGDDGDVVALPA